MKGEMGLGLTPAAGRPRLAAACATSATACGGASPTLTVATAREATRRTAATPAPSSGRASIPAHLGTPLSGCFVLEQSVRNRHSNDLRNARDN